MLPIIKEDYSISKKIFFSNVQMSKTDIRLWGIYQGLQTCLLSDFSQLQDCKPDSTVGVRVPTYSKAKEQNFSYVLNWKITTSSIWLMLKYITSMAVSWARLQRLNHPNLSKRWSCSKCPCHPTQVLCLEGRTFMAFCCDTLHILSGC